MEYPPNRYKRKLISNKLRTPLEILPFKTRDFQIKIQATILFLCTSIIYVWWWNLKLSFLKVAVTIFIIHLIFYRDILENVVILGIFYAFLTTIVNNFRLPQYHFCLIYTHVKNVFLFFLWIQSYKSTTSRCCLRASANLISA